MTTCGGQRVGRRGRRSKIVVGGGVINPRHNLIHTRARAGTSRRRLRKIGRRYKYDNDDERKQTDRQKKRVTEINGTTTRGGVIVRTRSCGAGIDFSFFFYECTLIFIAFYRLESCPRPQRIIMFHQYAERVWCSLSIRLQEDHCWHFRR